MLIETPYYLIHERKLLKNLKVIQYVREHSGVKSVLALKCFSTWSVFGLMKKYMDGTTASSVYEARLGYEKFGKEVHVYSVAFSQKEIEEVGKFSDTVIFNSVNQLKTFFPYVRSRRIGLRINPFVSYSHFDLADPARKFSRLGVVQKKLPRDACSLINGVMFHFNCENDNFSNFSSNLDFISQRYGAVLRDLEWVSLGGGIYFTKTGYPLEQFCKKLKEFRDRFHLDVYLEPGEGAITESTELVTRVLDIVRNKVDIAIVDASTEAHMLDLLVYRIPAKVENVGRGKFRYMITGRSCLAGDIFGNFEFQRKLKIGTVIKFSDAAGYTMVKKNWFNGLPMPAIVVERLDGSVEMIRRFNYKDFVTSLS